MEFRVLPADAPERLQLAQWYNAQWGRDAGMSLEQELQRLNQPQDAEGFPHLIAAFDGGQVAGAVQLKRREMQAFPQYEHWLGSVSWPTVIAAAAWPADWSNRLRRRRCGWASRICTCRPKPWMAAFTHGWAGLPCRRPTATAIAYW